MGLAYESYGDECNRKKERKNCPTIILCGNSTGSLTVTNTLTVLATIEVKIPKGCNPCLLIQYAITATAPSDSDNRSFLVRVFRNCENGYRVQVGTALHFDTTPRTNTFSGFACDCNNWSESESCIYTIEAQTTFEGHSLTGSATATAILGNSSLRC